ncbi:uncharacterized protein T551_02767 [Pneumocystis jirovecii RU7]|uniref:Ubiquinol-cytochrome C reductase hinge domain-containing protein n=1 Tax=Pneumocystis jirovecii (strain RU7) TaxID=1408657 RepID=A0A0W4ZIZ9_PNEJ7|nr:uncharacterized protein T551_02767 [Pneumocystis jirovecii RU7]KTW28348.1 hypothetical protein T551_02767 [Pneumocystis jirovecii RU7]
MENILKLKIWISDIMSFPLFVSAEESDYKIESSNNQEDKEKENYNGNDDDSDGDEKDPEDSMPLIQEECLNTKKCALLKHHYDECQKRIISVIEEAEGGKIDNENCVEEMFHMMHCIGNCSANKIFSELK